MSEMPQDHPDKPESAKPSGVLADTPEQRTTASPAFEKRIKQILSDTDPRDSGTGIHLPGGFDSNIPAAIGRFAVRGLIGAGAFGIVYRGFDETLNREVAIKVPRRREMSEREVQDFLRDARAVAAIRHQNVCPVYEVGRTEAKLPFIVLHLVPGTTLAAALEQRRRPFESSELANLMLKIAQGVAAAHSCGVTHRDLKPANILLDESGVEPVITDFGLAILAEETRATSTGTVKGTPAYMAPEQVRGEIESIGAPADVHALGVILYQLLTGSMPFRGGRESVLYQVVHEQPKAPSTIQPQIEPALELICLKAMRKKPSERFPSAREFADAVEQFLKTGTAPEGMRAELSKWPRADSPVSPAMPGSDAPDDRFFTAVSGLFGKDPALGPFGALIIGVVVFLVAIAALALTFGR